MEQRITFPDGSTEEFRSKAKRVPTHVIARQIDGEWAIIGHTTVPEAARKRELRDRPVGWEKWGEFALIELAAD